LVGLIQAVEAGQREIGTELADELGRVAEAAA
jgi:hypothetical protein